MTAGNIPPTKCRQPPLQVSRMLGVGVLLDPSELESLVASLPDLHFYQTSALCEMQEACVGRASFCQLYRRHMEALCEGENNELPAVSASVSPDYLYMLTVAEGKTLVRPCLPVIQVRPHVISYSRIDGKFRSMVHGQNAIAWGLHFSYPQLFQDPERGDIVRVDETFVNTEPFRRLQRWIRHATRATPFVVEGKRVYVPVRLGQIDWIARHPQLAAQGIQVGL